MNRAGRELAGERVPTLQMCCARRLKDTTTSWSSSPFRTTSPGATVIDLWPQRQRRVHCHQVAPRDYIARNRTVRGGDTKFRERNIAWVMRVGDGFEETASTSLTIGLSFSMLRPISPTADRRPRAPLPVRGPCCRPALRRRRLSSPVLPHTRRPASCVMSGSCSSV